MGEKMGGARRKANILASSISDFSESQVPASEREVIETTLGRARRALEPLIGAIERDQNADAVGHRMQIG